MKLDVLAFGAHPDDVEMSCGGTILNLVAAGKKVGIIDLTRGELGSRGSAELRDEEAAEAAKVLGLSVRENLCFRDGFFHDDEAHQLEVIRMIRKYQPEIVLGNAILDRHPDHGKGSSLVRNAVFLSGLKKIETFEKGEKQTAFRPQKYFTYIQDHHLEPTFVVDISSVFQQKMQAIACYKSQFYNPNSTEELTYISTKTFWDFFEARARNTGHLINVEHGEGFRSETVLKVKDIMELI